jgi:5-methylcytosine-specific restriction endonuclease McrA
MKVETITTKQILNLLEQQGKRCALTGWPLTPETASIDHVIPLSKGGDHSIDNAQIVDYRVNLAKGTMTNDEFIEMCMAVAENAHKSMRDNRLGLGSLAGTPVRCG